MNPLNLHTAEHLAKTIVEVLAPLCTRIEIAGSIRRRCPWVNDIDLVLIPRDPTELRARVLRKASPIQDGPLNLLVRLANGVQLDIFMAHDGRRDLISSTPSNFGSLLLCRTGSKEHNIKLATRALSLGLKWKIYEGIFAPTPNRNPNLNPSSEELIASATEHEIFTALQLDYIEPENRI